MASPSVLFSLKSFHGPTRQSHSCSSSSPRNCRPAPRARTPPLLLRRPFAAARAPLLHRFAAAPQTSRPSHARTALLRACTVCAPLTPGRRHPRPAPPLACTAAPPLHLCVAPCLQTRAHSTPGLVFRPPHPLFCVHARCSRNCLLGCFVDFFPVLQGYGLHTLWHVKFFWYIILCTHAHIHTPFLDPANPLVWYFDG